MKWLNLLAGMWVELGPEELGGVGFDGQSIVYTFKKPVAPTLTRARLTRTFPRRTSHGEVRGLTTGAWSGFMEVEAYRRKE